MVIEQNLVPKIETVGASCQTQQTPLQHQETNTDKPNVKSKSIQSSIVKQTSQETNTEPPTLKNKSIQSIGVVQTNQFTQSANPIIESQATQYEPETPEYTSISTSAQTSPKITEQSIALAESPIREKIDFGIQTTPGLKTWIFEREPAAVVSKYVKRSEVKASVTEKIQLLEMNSENDPPKVPSLKLGALKIQKIAEETIEARPVLTETGNQENSVGNADVVEERLIEKAGVHGLVGFWESQKASNLVPDETDKNETSNAADKINGDEIDEPEEIDILSLEIQEQIGNEDDEDIVSEEIQPLAESEDEESLSDRIHEQDGNEDDEENVSEGTQHEQGGYENDGWDEDNEEHNDEEDIVMEDREFVDIEKSLSDNPSDEEHEESSSVDFQVENEHYNQVHFEEEENTGEDLEHE
ncbi:hypothetical protein HK096_011088, partial [Nowakowskiella sp. JEL0078]